MHPLNNPPGTLMVELRFETPPQLDLEAVQRDVPDSVLLDPVIAHPRYVFTFEDGKVAAIGTAVLEPSGEPEAPPTTGQTWDWEEAGAVLERSPHSLLVSELFGRVHPPRDRMDAFLPALRAVIAHTRPTALWCPNSTRLMEPDFDHQYTPFVNVRLFRGDGYLLMDTLGLHVLGLRDYQCRFTDREPGDVAAALYNLAAYGLEQGDVIEDGDTMGEEYWRCRHAEALASPEREVVDLMPSG